MEQPEILRSDAEPSVQMPGGWHVIECNENDVLKLSQDAGISPVLARLAINRGLNSSDDIARFFHGEYKDIANPELMKDLSLASDRLVKACKEGEIIAVHGDYDADGICSTAILMRFFTTVGIKGIYHLPDRMMDGYGISPSSLEKFKAQGCSLLITVDCGISDFDSVSKASELGMDVIITDHHIPADKLPEALAVVDPKRADCSYPYKHLAGVGIAYTLCREVARKLEMPDPVELLELVAIGTVADCTPLTGENRILVKEGIRTLRSGITAQRYPGLSLLIESAKLSVERLNSEDISFTIAPRLYASGRLDSPEIALRLLLSENSYDAEEIAGKLADLNRERQLLTLNILEDTRKFSLKGSLPFFYSSEWHIGVIGCVSSRLKEEFDLPVFMISIDDDGLGTASVRSVDWFPLDKILPECADLLGRFGGHALAGGFTVKEENIPALRDRLQTFFDRMKPPESVKMRNVEVDMELPFGVIGPELLKDLNRLKPFGTGNPRPVFTTSGIRINKYFLMGAGKEHIRAEVYSEKARSLLQCVGFRMNEQIDMINSIDTDRIPFIMAYEVDENRWRGIRRLQLKMKDIVPET